MNPFTLSGLLVGISSSLMAFFVYLKGRKNTVNRIWALFALSVAIWGFGGYKIGTTADVSMAFFWWRLTHVGIIFIPVLFLHFVYVLLGRKRDKVLVTTYILGFFFQVANFTPLFIAHMRFVFSSFYWDSPPGLIYPFFALFFVSTIVYVYYVLFKALKKSSGIRKNQIKYFLLSVIIGYSGGTTCFLPCFSIDIYPIGNFLVALYVVPMAYAIVSHRLMDIEIVIQKATRIIFSFLISIGIYFAFFYLGYNIIGWNVWQATVFAIIPCLVCFTFIILRMQRVIFKKEEDYQEALIRTAGEMVRIRDPLKLIEAIANSVYNIIEARQISIFLLDAPTKEYVLQTGKGRIPLQGIGFKLEEKAPIINWFNKTGEEFYKVGLIDKKEKIFLQLDIIRQWLSDEKFLNTERKWVMALREIQFQMESLRASLIIPSRYGRRLLGLLCLGGREGVHYTQRDVEVLSGFADDVAMNIRNALLISDLRQKVHEKTRLSRERYDAYQKLERIFKDIISAFAMTVSKIDPAYTYEHVGKTFKYAHKLVDKLQPKEIKGKLISKDIFFAGILLHDIGKIFVPKNILNKSEELTSEEWEIVKRHPVDGFELLENIEGMEISAEIIRHHHERLDGKGYPDGLKGPQISMGARIVCVVDAFEAMTADRPYRKAKSKEEAIKELMENSGTQFDPQVVKAFVEVCEAEEIKV